MTFDLVAIYYEPAKVAGKDSSGISKISGVGMYTLSDYSHD